MPKTNANTIQIKISLAKSTPRIATMNAKKRSYHTMRDFLFVVFKHKVLIISLFLIIFLIAAVSCFFIPSTYEARAKLLVKEPARQTIALTKSQDTTRYTSNTKKQADIDLAVQLLKGRYLAEKVLDTIGLETLFPHIDSNEPEKALFALQNSLTVSGGTIIDVVFLHSNPALAAQTVNILVEEFLEHYLSVQKQEQQYEFFKNQVELIEKRLQKSQKELGLFRNEHNISSIQKQKSLLLLQISDLEVELAKIRAAVSEQESIAKANKKSSAEAVQIQQKIIALKSKDKKLSQHITRYKVELNRLDKAETRLRELERRVTMDEENYLLYTKKMEEARITSAMDEQKLITFSIIEPALQPLVPVKPHKSLILLTAVIIGLLGGLLLALVSEYFTHTFDNAQDIEEILGCTAMTALPELSSDEINLIKAGKLPEKIHTKCNRIKQYVIQTFPDVQDRTILLNGPNEGEGTSLVLLNLALALASEGGKVLVVDANLRNPTLHNLLNVEQTNGLAEALGGDISTDTVIKNTQVSNLMIISSGRPPANPFALLQSEQFERLLQELKTKADWILLDSPPIHTYNDAGLMGPKTDGVAMVVKAGKTRWEVAASAIHRFQQCNAKILGAVLNRQKMHIPEWLYKIL